VSDHLPTCPHCHELLAPDARYACPHCGRRIDLLPSPRKRWFCCLCGAMTTRDPGTKRYATCHAHSSVTVDFVPPDPLESLPMNSAELGEAASPTREREDC